MMRMRVSPQARQRNPELPAVWEVRAVSYQHKDKRRTVYTSLPAEHDDPHVVARWYRDRWEIEVGFRDIKSSLQHNVVTLRKQDRGSDLSGSLGPVLGYNVIRREASQAAVAHGQDPARIRRKFAYQYITAQLIVMVAAQPLSRTGARLSELRASIGQLFLDDRPRPARPRSVKRSKTRYPVNRHAAPLISPVAKYAKGCDFARAARHMSVPRFRRHSLRSCRGRAEMARVISPKKFVYLIAEVIK